MVKQRRYYNVNEIISVIFRVPTYRLTWTACYNVGNYLSP